MLKQKSLPRPLLRLVFSPQSDEEYIHFEDAHTIPFDHSATDFSRINAWWMSDASLLSYWDTNEATRRFKDQAGLDCLPLSSAGTQGYVASNAAFAIVAFRGTEPDSILDIVTDARLELVDWDVRGESVHEGFRDALNDIWDDVLKTVGQIPSRSVWFTGHSLGAAVATLAADRYAREARRDDRPGLGGVYTFGSPLVGDRAFVDGFNRRCGAKSFRFVNDQDSVTRVPPPIAKYRHVNNERFVGFDDPDVHLTEPLIDHTPRRYAVLVWNALVDSVIPTS